jgi:hypothetical protein
MRWRSNKYAMKAMADAAVTKERLRSHRRPSSIVDCSRTHFPNHSKRFRLPAIDTHPANSKHDRTGDECGGRSCHDHQGISQGVPAVLPADVRDKRKLCPPSNHPRMPRFPSQRSSCAGSAASTLPATPTRIRSLCRQTRSASRSQAAARHANNHYQKPLPRFEANG